jgi:hypothetical protein
LPRSVIQAGALALGILASACPGSSSDKAEAAAVSHAVRALRAADNEKKRELLAALRATACNREDVCAVRSACLAAYELHVETLARLQGAVTGTPEAGAFDALKNDLGRARDLAGTCTDAEGEMIRRYKL